MASYYPPTNYFQNINFNNDFYATPNNNQGVKLEYANTHYLFSTGIATSTAFTTFFSGSIGIGTVGGVAGSINALDINAINSLQINGNNISNIYISSNVLPNFLLPYDKIIDRQDAITALSNLFISSNVIPIFLAPYDKIVDRQTAVTALSNTIISSSLLSYDKIVDRQTAVTALSNTIISSSLLPFDKIIDRQTAVTALSNTIISSSLLPYDKMLDRQTAITALSNTIISSSLLPYDKIIDRQTAITALSNTIISSLLLPFDKIVDRQTAITALSNTIISSSLLPYDKIVDRQTAITALSNTIISSSLLPYDKIVDRQNADTDLQTSITANTNAIGGCLKTTSVQVGNIGLFYAGSVLSVVSNPEHFIDVSVLATNRQFNLAPIYANLPTTKNNKITWNSPLIYNVGTDTASIDLSSITNAIQATSNQFQYYNTTSADNILMNNTSNYIRTLNQATSNQFQYYVTSNTDVINRNNTSNYVVSLNQQTNNQFQYYITSNTDVTNRNNTSNYIVSLNQQTSNQFQYYITSNSDVTNRNNTSNYIKTLNQATSNQFQYYVTSNTDVINRNNTSNYIVSLNQATSNQFQFYNTSITDNTNMNNTSNYIVSLNQATSNQFQFYNTSIADAILMNNTSNYIRTLNQATSDQFQYYSTSITDNTNMNNTSNYIRALNQATNNQFQFYNTSIADAILMNNTSNYIRTLNQATSNQFQYYNTVIADALLMNNTSNYIVTLNQATSNQFQYYITSNTDVANRSNTSNYIVSLNQATSNQFQYYITSNTDVANRSNTSNYIVSLNQSTSNQFQYYITSNTDVANRSNTSNYIVSLNQQTSNQFQFYMTSNTVNNLFVSLSDTYVSSNVLSTQLYTAQDVYSVERDYPPKAYNSATNDILTNEVLNKSVYTQKLTLNTDGITYGSGEYTIYSSSFINSVGYLNDKKLLFDYNLTNSSGVHWGIGNYTPNGVYNKSDSIKSDYLGDWIIIKLPIPIILTKYYFRDRSALNYRAPAQWNVYGSNDGINFIEIIGASQTTRLIPTDYVNGFYTKIFLNTVPYQYIGFTFNKVVGTTNGDLLNFSELRLSGKVIETLTYPTYVSSNVLPNILQPFDTILSRENAVIGLSNISVINTNNTSNYIKTLNQQTSNQFQYYLPKVITNSNIYFDTPLQILPNTQPIGFKLQNSSFLIGDGGRLLINGNYGGSNGSNFTRIGVADLSSTRSGLDNTQIHLYEKGFITYDAPTNPIAYGHVFNGNVRMSSLSIASQTVPNSNIRFEVGGSGSGANPFSIDVYGNITLNKVASANNLTLKAPLYFTVSQQATISGKTVYKYDLDLSLYTRFFQTLEGHKVRYFKITSIYSDGSALDGLQLQAYNYMFSNTFYMTDKNGLTMYCNDNWTNTQCEFIANDIPINYWIRNSFDYITFINRLSIANNRKWYILIQDYLS